RPASGRSDLRAGAPGAGGRRPHWHLGRPVAAVEAGHCRALGGLRTGRLHKEAPASAGRAWPAPVADPHLADPRSQPSGTLCRKGLSRCAACRGGAVRASNLRCSTASHALASIAVGIVIIISAVSAAPSAVSALAVDEVAVPRS